ncbi:MAG: 3-oxoacyl-[acyl-carrier protein] reductase [uncultured Friedmanniella sp.]|uniref:3-oxoacyl-[acyl-carrier protein] reductase n=1 Tax=uncultured Friedmanniella sp. TaxID=335381 RepID=A0A6J4LW46_9ACTN|nr:glucose 1-dehydrogenase [uncultured Friedmanniella sp.]CAA9339709.1 MAG: 3-oxoacyl-[acyl-carrier protein] reductase [uncultured Friedmanniella sp.]
MRFADQVALITGAGSGIGRSTAALFAAEGARVVVLDINASAAEETASALDGAVARTLDIRDLSAASAVVDQVLTDFGRVDVLVNNAMRIAPGELDEREDDGDMLDELDVDLLGAFRMTRVCLPPMRRQRRGAIVNVSSVNGLAYFGNDLYSAAKAGLVSLTRSVAARHGRDGIRCNAVAPGTIATPNWTERVGSEPGFLERVGGYYPLGRVGRPEEVAEAIAFLASDQASWITGVTLPVDGGLMTGHFAMAKDITSGGR